MASQTFFPTTPTLPASITSPPTAQFTPGPGCVDQEDHWVVVTSCGAFALGENHSLHPSPDWLTCQLTQFGPPENGPASCYVPYSAQTVVDAETSFYSGCPSGYTGALTLSNSRSDGLETDFDIFCCPTQYNFNVDNYFTGDYMKFTTERDGVSYDAGYPLPGCATSRISELSGKDIAVQTQFNTYEWEKRQVANVPWDYLHGTMYAEVQSYSYTVFHGTHTCYQDCSGWYDYYFSGSSEPPFTVINTVPVTTTPLEEPTMTAFTSSEGETGTPPVEETDEPSIPSASIQTISSTTEEDMPPTTSSIEQTPAPTPAPSGSNGDITSSTPSPPSSTTSDVPTGAAAVVTPTRVVLLGLFLSLVAL